MPGLEAVKSMFSGTPDLDLQNPIIKAHEKHGRGWEIINEYIKRDYKTPTDFVKYNYISQLLQARGMRIAVEAHRRAKPYNMGTLYWQLNDCWPVVSWSSIDYLGNWKALHYQLKRSFEQQVILVDEKEGILNLYAINDGVQTFNGVNLEIKTSDFNGKVLKEYNAVSDKKNLENILKFNPVETIKLLPESNKNKVFLKLTLKDQSGKVIAENIHFFSKPKDLQLTKPNLKIRRIGKDEIKISTDVLAKDVYLIGDIHFSDNFFDLLPNTSKRIKLSKPLENIEVMSLWDTLQN